MPKKSASVSKTRKNLSTLAPKASATIRGGGINRIVVIKGTISAKV